MRYTLSACLCLCLFLPTTATAAEAPYSVERAKADLPEKLGEGFKEQLAEEAYRLKEGDETAATIWFVKQVPVPLATARQLQRDRLDYRTVPHTALIGVIRLDSQWSDFRKQKVEPGLYTLRLGFQPQDGDHMGTAPFNEFLLLVPADKDTDPDLIDVRDLQEMSSKAAGGTHPGVMLLFPNYQPEEEAKLVDQGDAIWTLNLTRPADADGKKATLPFALVVKGHSASE